MSISSTESNHTAVVASHYPAAAWMLVAVIYAVAFMQRTAPQTINDYLILDFQTTTQGVAAIASAYFLGYTLMQFPAGVLVDCYGPRKIILLSTAVSGIGTLLFSLAGGTYLAGIARFIIAFGDALVFTCLIKLVAISFPDKKFGTMSGLSQLAGYLGGVGSTVPLAFCVHYFGWRMTFSVLAGFLLALLPFLKITLPSRPTNENMRERFVFVGRTAWKRIRERATWGCALTFSLHFIPVTTLTGIWGIPMLMDEFGLSKTQASQPMMLMMISTMLGSLFFGYVSDRVHSIFSSQMWLISVRSLCFIILLPPVQHAVGLEVVTASLSCLGFVAGGTVPFLLKSLKKIHSSETIGIGGSINTTVSGVLMVIAQPVIAFSLTGTPQTSQSIAEKAAMNYSGMITMLLLLSVAGFIGPLLMKREITNRP